MLKKYIHYFVCGVCGMVRGRGSDRFRPEEPSFPCDEVDNLEVCPGRFGYTGTYDRQGKKVVT